MLITNRVIVGGGPNDPGREYNPGDEDDFEDGTAETLQEQGVAKPTDKKQEKKDK